MTDLIIEPTEQLWASSPVLSCQGVMEEIREYVPTFKRCAFGFEMRDPIYRGPETLFDSPEVPPGINPYFDSIVRLPLAREADTTHPVPVGIVSGNYTLLQHHEVIDEVFSTLDQSGFETDSLMAQMDMTPLGERMRLQVVLPEKYHLTISADDHVALRLICNNSVDGSVAFSALTGWFRLICSNGMVVGTTHQRFRQRHNRQMVVSDMMQVLSDGIRSSTKERGLMKKWQQRILIPETVHHWVDTTLAKQWGVKAAVRALHILTSGFDVHLTDPFEKRPPTEKSVKIRCTVPGAKPLGLSVFAAAQALAWLAKERRDVQEQLQWMQQIPTLIAPLLKLSSNVPAA